MMAAVEVMTNRRWCVDEALGHGLMMCRVWSSRDRGGGKGRFDGAVTRCLLIRSGFKAQPVVR